MTASEADSVKLSSESRREPIVTLLWTAVAAGVFLRIVGADHLALWEDEWWTVWRTDGSFLKTFYALRKSPFPPLHYLSVWTMRNFSGAGVSSIRWMSVVAGVTGVLSTWYVWKLVMPNRSALWAAALVSISGYHYHYSQDAKMYAAVWLWSSLGCGLYLHCVLNQARRWHYVGLAVANGCVVMTSYVGVLSLGIQGLFSLYLFIFRSEYRRKLLVTWFVIGLGLLPTLLWADYALQAATERSAGTWMPAAAVSLLPLDVFRLNSLWLCGIWLGDCEPQSPWQWTFFVAAVAGTMLFAACLFLSRREARPQPKDRLIQRFLLLWLIFPVAAAAVFSLTIYSLWGVPRYLMGCSPAVPLLIGYLAGRQQRAAIACGVVLLAINLVAIQYRHTAPVRSPWDEIAGSIRIAAATSDLGEKISVSWTSVDDRYINPMVVEAVLRREGLKVEMIEFDTIKENVPQFIIFKSEGTHSRIEGRANSLIPGRECILIFRTIAHEETYSRLPAPFDEALTEVWICR